MMYIQEIAKVLDRLEGATDGGWDATVAENGSVSLTTESDTLAENLKVNDAWFISHSKEDISVLMNEVLDFRKLLFDVKQLLAEEMSHDMILAYIEGILEDRL